MNRWTPSIQPLWRSYWQAMHLRMGGETFPLSDCSCWLYLGPRNPLTMLLFLICTKCGLSKNGTPPIIRIARNLIFPMNIINILGSVLDLLRVAFNIKMKGLPCHTIVYSGFHEWWYPIMDCFNGKPVRIDDLEVPLFQETSIWFM